MVALVISLYYLLIFIAGIFVGSFLNVISDRLQTGEAFIKNRSRCDKCKTVLKVLDLVPLLSFSFLRGKCRYCKTKLSYYYPISEFLTGIGFVAVAKYSGFVDFLSGYSSQGVGGQNFSVAVWFLYLVIILCLFIVMFLSDAKYRILPDTVMFPAIALVCLMLVGNLVYERWTTYHALSVDPFGKYLLQAGFWHNHLVTALSQLGYTFVSACIIYAFFWGLVYFTKGRGMGGGDVKLALLIGLFNGFPYNILAIFLGFLFGASFSLILIALKKKTMKSTIAFGPFLILGSLVTLFFGKTILQVYLGAF